MKLIITFVQYPQSWRSFLTFSASARLRQENLWPRLIPIFVMSGKWSPKKCSQKLDQLTPRTRLPTVLHMETFGTSDWRDFDSCDVFGLVNVHLIKTLVPLFPNVFHVHSQNYLINNSSNWIFFTSNAVKKKGNWKPRLAFKVRKLQLTPLYIFDLFWYWVSKAHTNTQWWYGRINITKDPMVRKRGSLFFISENLSSSNWSFQFIIVRPAGIFCVPSMNYARRSVPYLHQFGLLIN